MDEFNIDRPIACLRLDDVSSLETQKKHAALRGSLEQGILEIEARETGYAFRFPLEDGLFRDLAEYITYERLCCPFFHFALELDPGKEEVRLVLTGGPGVKDFLTVELAGRRTVNRNGS